MKDRQTLFEKDTPNMIGNPNFERLKSKCQAYIDTIAGGGLVDEDTVHLIFETALETFFGKDVWKWVNDRQ